MDRGRARDWSADPRYGLDDPGDLPVIDQTVLDQAATAGQLHRHLDAETLHQVRPTRRLPARGRAACEAAAPRPTGPGTLVG